MSKQMQQTELEFFKLTSYAIHEIDDQRAHTVL